MLNNLKFQYKILIFPILFVITFIIVASISSQLNKNSKKMLKQTEEVYLPSIEVSIKLKSKLQSIQRTLQDAVASADELKLEEADTISKAIHYLCLSINKNNQRKTLTDSISDLFTKYYNNARIVSAEMIEGSFSEALSVKIKKMIEEYKEVDALIKILEQNSKQEIKKHFKNIEENYNKVQSRNIFVIIIALTLFLSISYLISKSIVNPIEKIVGYMYKIANKNLDFTIKDSRKDEIGTLYKSINKIILNFGKIISEISGSATAVLGASNQLSSTSQQLSQSSNEQAATTEEISSAMEEMLSTIISNTESAQDTSKISSLAAQNIKESNASFSKTIDAVNNISESINIVSVIANQTNLLSLNASVEAARAGKAGRGFAVVAAEVKKLAEKSKIASEKILKMSKSGTEISKIAGENLEKIIPEIIKSAELVKNIVVSSNEQQNGITSISQSVQQLMDITNQNSASSEQMSASAEELSAQAEQLESIISVFNIGNDVNQ